MHIDAHSIQMCLIAVCHMKAMNQRIYGHNISKRNWNYKDEKLLHGDFQ